MTDDFFALEGYLNALEGNVEVARRREMHLAGFKIGVFCFAKVAGGFCRAGLLFPAYSQLIPHGCPKLAFDAGQLRQRFFGFVFVSMIEWRSMAHPAANIIFDFVQGSWLVHTDPSF